MTEDAITPEKIVKRLDTMSVEDIKKLADMLGVGIHTISSFRKGPTDGWLDDDQLAKLVRFIVGRQNIELVEGHFVTVAEHEPIPLNVQPPRIKRRTDVIYYDPETGQQSPTHARAPRPVAEADRPKPTVMERIFPPQKAEPLYPLGHVKNPHPVAPAE